MFSLAAVAGTLIACNAILGVGNVTLQKPGGSDGSIDDEGGGGGPDPFNPDGPDGEAPVDKGTIALGFNHGCARVPDGTVKCWGDNGAGELGDGLPYDGSTDLDHAVTPQIVPSLKDAIAIAAGLVHTCAIRSTNEVVCWGINSFGQLGNGTQDRSSVPVQVMLTSDTPLNDAVALTGGQSFTCALRKDKTVACWGADYSGQLGDGAKVDSRPKAAPVIGLGGVIALSAARDHVCAILESGKLSCWGGNTYGQLGIGSLDESLQPKELTALVDVSQVAAADQFTCARLKSGKVECWGQRATSSDSSATAVRTPIPIPPLSSSRRWAMPCSSGPASNTPAP